LKFLLDINVISELRKRDRAHPNVTKWALQTPALEIGTSVLVLAEIRRGIELKRRSDPFQADLLDDWYESVRSGLGDRVLPVNETVSEVWARMSAPDPLPFIDGLLAATAKVYGMTLVTRNMADMIRTGVVVVDPFANG
jgi:predicted nucleic acid-binding protein